MTNPIKNINVENDLEAQQILDSLCASYGLCSVPISSIPVVGSPLRLNNTKGEKNKGWAWRSLKLDGSGEMVSFGDYREGSSSALAVIHINRGKADKQSRKSLTRATQKKEPRQISFGGATAVHPEEVCPNQEQLKVPEEEYREEVVGNYLYIVNKDLSFWFKDEKMLKDKCDNLVIPFVHRLGGEVTGYAWIGFSGLKGFKKGCLLKGSFTFCPARNKKKRYAHLLFLTEGWADAQTLACVAGIDSCCLHGVGNLVDGARSIMSDPAFVGRRLILARDGDTAGRAGAGKLLNTLGIESIEMAKGNDVSEAYRLLGVEGFCSLVDELMQQLDQKIEEKSKPKKEYVFEQVNPETYRNTDIDPNLFPALIRGIIKTSGRYSSGKTKGQVDWTFIASLLSFIAGSIGHRILFGSSCGEGGRGFMCNLYVLVCGNSSTGKTYSSCTASDLFPPLSEKIIAFRRAKSAGTSEASENGRFVRTFSAATTATFDACVNSFCSNGGVIHGASDSTYSFDSVHRFNRGGCHLIKELESICRGKRRETITSLTQAYDATEGGIFHQKHTGSPSGRFAPSTVSCITDSSFGEEFKGSTLSDGFIYRNILVKANYVQDGYEGREYRLETKKERSRQEELINRLFQFEMSFFPEEGECKLQKYQEAFIQGEFIKANMKEDWGVRWGIFIEEQKRLRAGKIKNKHLDAIGVRFGDIFYKVCGLYFILNTPINQLPVTDEGKLYVSITDKEGEQAFHVCCGLLVNTLNKWEEISKQGESRKVFRGNELDYRNGTRIIKLINAKGERTLTQISRAKRLPLKAVKTLLEDLVENGFVEIRDEQNNRVDKILWTGKHRINITEEGRCFCAEEHARLADPSDEEDEEL